MKYFELTDDGKRKLESLPIATKTIVKFLIESLVSLFKDDCNEEDIANVANTLKENSNNRIGNEDVMNYDEAGKALGFGATNRNTLKSLLDKNGIKQVYINNMPCGFLRKEIMALRERTYEDVRRREIKRMKKKAYPK